MVEASSRYSLLGVGILAAALAAFVAASARADLFVSSNSTTVVQYDEKSGDFLNIFASCAPGPSPVFAATLFGRNGNLYVASSSSYDGGPSVLRYDGTTGVLIDSFVTSSGELSWPRGMIFGPD